MLQRLTAVKFEWWATSKLETFAGIPPLSPATEPPAGYRAPFPKWGKAHFLDGDLNRVSAQTQPMVFYQRDWSLFPVYAPSSPFLVELTVFMSDGSFRS